MATITLGQECLVKAKLVIVSGVTFRAAFMYREGAEALPVGFDGWKAYMDFHLDGEKAADFDSCVTLAENGFVEIHMRPEDTARLEEGDYDFDIILEDAEGDNVRLAAGIARVKPRYSEEG